MAKIMIVRVSLSGFAPVEGYPDTKKNPHRHYLVRACGAPYWTRTSDPRDVNTMLYRLSQRCIFRTFWRFSGKTFGFLPEIFRGLSEQFASISFTPT